jgi:DNA-binding GntR family transcriptional regulator
MKIKPPDSINEQVFEYLLGQIQSGAIGSGARLIETQVAQELETSRTPVREAFKRLEQDGIVERLPQGGVRVTPITKEIVDEIFGIRGVLEPYAISLACDGIDRSDIQNLKHLAFMADDLIQSDDVDEKEKIKELFTLNTNFHSVLYAASGSPYLVKLINQLGNIVLRLRAMGLRKKSAWQSSWEEHRQLIKLLEKRDKKGAAKLMKRHVENAKSDVAACVDSTGRGEKK